MGTRCKHCGKLCNRMLPGNEFCSTECLVKQTGSMFSNAAKAKYICVGCSRGINCKTKWFPFCRKKCKAKNKIKVPSANKKAIRKPRKVKPKKVHVIDLWSAENKDRWLKLRYECFKKYGRKCLVCGATNQQLHVDHIKPKSIYPELCWDINNLQVLCKDCNFGKGNTDETDWR